jgi:hypothetical protein
MMRFAPVYAPDGMMSAGHTVDRFDDGLVHNHHWAVSADEAYPSHDHGPTDRHHASREVHATSTERFSEPTHTYDRHDDGLVHNHDWAVSDK